VLGTGEIMEKGTHTELIEKKGSYFNLVKNQLELESLNDKK
jgi:ATP-binding cassette subfamily B protein